jgi:hypothetical protein
MSRRRLRKAERDQVAAAVAPSVERVRPAVLEIEREIVDQLLPSLPADLREHAVYEFMNELGWEIFAEAELYAQIAEEDDR